MEKTSHVSHKTSVDSQTNSGSPQNPAGISETMNSKILREQSRAHLRGKSYAASSFQFQQQHHVHQHPGMPPYAYTYPQAAPMPYAASPGGAYIGSYQQVPSYVGASQPFTGPMHHQAQYSYQNALSYQTFPQPSYTGQPYAAYPGFYGPHPMVVPAVYYARPGSVFQTNSPLQDLAKVIKRKLFGDNVPSTRSGLNANTLSAKTWLNVRKAQKTLQQNWQQEKNLNTKASQQEREKLQQQTEADGIDALFPANAEAFNFESLLPASKITPSKASQSYKADEQSSLSYQADSQLSGADQNIRAAFDLYAAEGIAINAQPSEGSNRLVADFVYDYAHLPVPVVFQHIASQPVSVNGADNEPVTTDNKPQSLESAVTELSSENRSEQIHEKTLQSASDTDRASEFTLSENQDAIPLEKSAYFDKRSYGKPSFENHALENLVQHAPQTLPSAQTQALDALFVENQTSIEASINKTPSKKTPAGHTTDNVKPSTGLFGKIAGMLKTCLMTPIEVNIDGTPISSNSIKSSQDILSLGTLREQAKVVLKDALQNATLSNEAMDKIDTDELWQQYERMENRARAQKQMVNGLLDVNRAFDQEKLAYAFLSELPEYDAKTGTKISGDMDVNVSLERDTSCSHAQMATLIADKPDQERRVIPLTALSLVTSDAVELSAPMQDSQGDYIFELPSRSVIASEPINSQGMLITPAVENADEISEIEIPEDEAVEIFEEIELVDTASLLIPEAALTLETPSMVETNPTEDVTETMPVTGIQAVSAMVSSESTSAMSEEQKPEEFTFQSMLRNNHILSRSISTLASRYFESAEHETLLHELLE